MKRWLIPAAAVLFLFGCNSETDKGKFTVDGEFKNAADQKIYLEQLFFTQKDPEVLDTAEIKGGKFTVSTIAAEEGLYRLRFEKDKAAFFFINDGSKMKFIGDATKQGFSGWSFSGSANSSLKNMLAYNDSVNKVLNVAYGTMMQLQQTAKGSDSALIAATTTFNIEKEALTKYCFKYADTASNPMVAVFAATMAPVDVDKLVLPVENLSKRFPKHNGVAGTVSFIKTKMAQMLQQSQQQDGGNTGLAIGSMAPEITMNDVNDKPFSLSSLRGKYVLIDFWASWCGPCRGENPNVVAAYNSFKNKNFTVLGVSLDDDKEKWKQAIAADKLTWDHISDPKGLNESSITTVYGFNSIPFNVLIDPSGKVIAQGLRGEALESKLREVIK